MPGIALTPSLDIVGTSRLPRNALLQDKTVIGARPFPWCCGIYFPVRVVCALFPLLTAAGCSRSRQTQGPSIKPLTGVAP